MPVNSFASKYMAGEGGYAALSAPKPLFFWRFAAMKKFFEKILKLS